MTYPFQKDKWKTRFALGLLGVLLGAAIWTHGQRRNPRRISPGFDDVVFAISFSPDGQTLVSGSSEFRSSKIQEKAQSRDGLVFGELKWWDANSGELIHKLTMPGEGNSSLDTTSSP